MLKKDEVSKYTVPKNALDMLEWPPYSNYYTAKDIPMTDSNIPGTEVTQTPGLIPETTTEYDPSTANVDTAVPPTTPDTLVPPTETGTEWDGSTNYVAPKTAAEYYTNEDGQYTEAMAGTKPTPEEAHAKMMGDPHYAVHIHERQLEQLAKMIEEIAERLIGLEKKVIDMEQAQMGVDDNNPIVNYPEVQMHQKR